MLGVAIPGIAPTHGVTSPAPLQPTPSPTSALAQSVAGPSPAMPPAGSAGPVGAPRGMPIPGGRTMLGVAVPGIAPTHGAGPADEEPARFGTQLGMGAAEERPPVVVVVPRPATLMAEAAPMAPVMPARRGVPVALVAGLGLALVALVGALVLVLWRGAPPLVAQPRLDAQGKEVLHVRCESCPDDTVLTLAESKATVKGAEADVPLAVPLHVGDNSLTLAIDRPGVGRDEEVSLAVPLAYRIRADLAELGAKVPTLRVLVEAQPDSTVLIDGKPVALGPGGKGEHRLDLTSEVTGPAAEPKVLERNLPYEVTLLKGTPERGTVSARVAVVPLQVDAPVAMIAGARIVTEGASVLVAGRTARGASVTVGGKPAPATPEGFFEQTVDLPEGASQVEIRAQAQGVAPRMIRLEAHRGNMEAEGRAFEATAPLGYDAVVANVDAAVGKPIVVEGEIIEARTAGRQTVALVDDQRGCARGPCVTRVVLRRDLGAKRGEAARFYGHVARSAPALGGKVVPEVEADFALRGRGRR